MRTFRLDPYGLKLTLLTGRVEAAKAHAKSGLGEYPTEVAGTCWRADSTVYVAVHDRSRATLVHEIGHAALRVMEFIGHTVTTGTDEPFCYLLDHMFALCEPHVIRACPRSSSPADGCTAAS